MTKASFRLSVVWVRFSTVCLGVFGVVRLQNVCLSLGGAWARGTAAAHVPREPSLPWCTR